MAEHNTNWFQKAKVSNRAKAHNCWTTAWSLIGTISYVNIDHIIVELYVYLYTIIIDHLATMCFAMFLF